MSRSGYEDDCDDQWVLIRYRGAVRAAIRGARGQAFLNELLEAVEMLPEQKLIAHELERGDQVCAIGAVGRRRGIELSGLDPEDAEAVAKVFGIAPALAREIVYMNDEGASNKETNEQRFSRMRAWIKAQIGAR
jgi:hypothetical protein